MNNFCIPRGTELGFKWCGKFQIFLKKKLTEYIVGNSKIYLEQFQIPKLDLIPLVDYFHLSRWCEGGVASGHYKVFGSLPQHLPGEKLTPGKLLRFIGNGTSLPIHVIIYHDMFSFTCTNIYVKIMSV